MNVRAMLVAIILAVGSSTYAATETIRPPVCKDWLKEPTQYRIGWLLGYLSGLNARDIIQARGENRKGPHSLTALQSPEMALEWMQQHCIKNPDHDFAYAGLGLWMAIGAASTKDK